MILATRDGVDQELRLFEGAGFIPRPGSAEADSAIYGGTPRLRELAIPAFACAVRLVSESIACFVLRTYAGDAEQRAPVLSSPQARLFQEPRASEECSSFDVWCDLVTCLELEQNAFLWKTVTSRGVEELYPVDPQVFQVTREKGVKKIRAKIEGRTREVTSNVVHIRAWSNGPNVNGLATPDLHRRALKTAQSLDIYRGRYFDNDATPPFFLVAPAGANLDRPQRQEMLEGFVSRNGGPWNAGKPGMLWGGVELKQVSNTMKDAQGAEMQAGIVRDVARIMRIYPAELLYDEAGEKGSGPSKSPENISELFYRFSLYQRMRRIERALAADRQLFPDPKLYPSFDVSGLIRADFQTLATAVHSLVQDGVITYDEGRAMLGLPPAADGQGGRRQLTPVGGAPNPSNDAAAAA